MKLDRNTTNPRRGKYALIKLRGADLKFSETLAGKEYVSVPAAAVDFGNTADSDFFVIRLKDRFAGPALHAYAEAARHHDVEYAAEVEALAQKADHHPLKRAPD